MQKSQAGFVQLLLIILLLIGIGVGVYLVQFTQVFKPKAAETNPTIHHILSTGQSLSQGYDAVPALTTTQPFNNLKLNDSMNSLAPDFEDGSLNYQFVPLTEGDFLNFESPASAMGNSVTQAAGGSYQTLITKHGVGSSSYSMLKKGTPAFTKGINQVKTAKKNAAQLGRPYKVEALTVIHGESGPGTDPGDEDYEKDLVKWIDDYNSEVKAVTGQTESFPMITDQMAAIGFGGIHMAQLAAAEHNPGKIFLVGPKYQYIYAAGPHLTNISSRRLGEQYGKVYKLVVIDKKQWLPLSPKEITKIGNVITLKLNVPAPPVKIDTQTVLTKPNFGFEYKDSSSNPPPITRIEITGPDTIQITLSAVPTGANPKLSYAAQTITRYIAGANIPDAVGGNISDSDNTPSLYGNNLANWLVQFEKPIGVGIPALAAQYTPDAKSYWPVNQNQQFKVTVKNIGSETWFKQTGTVPTGRTDLAVYIGPDAEWTHAQTSTLSPLTSDLAPGQSQVLTVNITSPAAPGNYVLRMRMVKQGFAWFDDVQEIPITVMSPVTLSAPASVATSTSTVTFNWNIPNGATGYERVNPYEVGAPDSEPLGSIFLSCTGTPPPTPLPTGSCTIPNLFPNPAKKYELRMFAKDGATVIAKSNPITVAAPNSPSPAASVKPGDTDGDGDVDIFDYNLVLGDFGKTNDPLTKADLDNDNDVDIFDYNIVVGNFGK